MIRVCSHLRWIRRWGMRLFEGGGGLVVCLARIMEVDW